MKKIYCIYDKIKEQGEQFVLCSNDQDSIRTIYPIVSRICPLQDIEIRCLGEFEQQTCEYVPINDDVCYRVVSWDSYKFPISQADNLSVFGSDVVESFKQLQEHQTEKKNECTIDEV